MIELKVDIVIVNWNSSHYLHDCLQSIAGRTDDTARIQSITIVDNASIDGSENISIPNELTVHWIRNEANLGFSKACNQGAAIGNAPVLLFLNPDTRLMDGSLSTPLAYLDSPEHQTTAVVGIQMLDDHGEVARTCARFPSSSHMLMRSLGLDQIPRLYAFGYLMREWSHRDTREVDHVIGAFYLIRRAVFDELRGFCEDFFVYLEDLDLSARVRKLGLKCLYLTTAAAYHAEGGSSRNIKAQRLCYALNSRLIYASKHFSRPGRYLVTLSTLTAELLIRFIKAAWSGSAADIAGTLRGYRLLYAKLIRGRA